MTGVTLVGDAGNNVLNGGSDGDTLEGQGGNDTLDGGGGTDTAIYAGAMGDYSIGMVTNAAGRVIAFTSVADNDPDDGNEGFDTLVNVERLLFINRLLDLTHDVQLFDQSGRLQRTFATIQEAIDVAQDNYTIRVGAGVFSEDLVVDVGVTIIGANATAVGGRDAAGGAGETTIIGHAEITSASGVTIDGVRFVNDATTTGGGPASPTLQILSGGGAEGHLVTNSIFWSSVMGGSGGVDDRAIALSPISGGSVTISDNLISGASQGQYGTASWGRAIWFDGGGIALNVTGNVIEWSRTGLNLDMGGSSTATVMGNSLHGLGSGISVGVDSDGLTIADNDLQQVGTDFNLQNLTGDTVFDAAAAIDTLTASDPGNDPVVVLGGGGDDELTGTSAGDVLIGNGLSGAATDEDSLHGAGGADLLQGRGGDDALDGGAGDDQLEGGAGVDIATVSGLISITPNGTTWTIVSDDGSDTLVDVEVVLADGARTLLVGSGGFATIQAAVNAAQGGDTILIASGTYVEQVTIDGLDNLSIRPADGASVTIEAPLDLVNSAFSSSDRSVNAVVTVTDGTNVTIEGITVDGAGAGNSVDVAPGHGSANFVGVFYRNASGGLTDVDITGVHDTHPGGVTAGGHPVQSGVQRGVGLQVDNDTLMSFFMHGGTIDDFQKNATAFSRADLDVSGVTVTGGGAQTIIAQNGFQASNSTGSINGNTITDIGYAGPADAYSGAMLLFTNTDLAVTGNTIVGANGESAAAKVLGIYVYDGLGPNSGGEISGNTISHVDAGIGIYGAVGNAIGINSNTVTDLDGGDPYVAGVDFQVISASGFSVEGTGEHDVLFGSNGADSLAGLGGDDDLSGGVGNDALDGGLGHDTASFAGARADYAIGMVTDAQGRVTGFTSAVDGEIGDGDEGSDTLASIEALAFADVAIDLAQSVQLFDGSDTLIGTFDSIQAAVNAAQDGYSILLDAGTYNETVTVNKDVTIAGPNAGTPGTAARAGEAEVTAFYISAAGVTLDGITVLNGATPGGNSAGVFVNADDVTLTNMVFQGDGTSERPAVTTPYNGGVTGLELSDSLVTGWHWGAYFNPSTQFTASGNSFEGNGNGILGDDWAAGTAISGNSFTNSSGSHIGYGSFDSVEDVGDFVGANTFDPGSLATSVFAYGDGDPGGQVLTGTNESNGIFASEFVANSGTDSVFYGLGGDDHLEGGSGFDVLFGGDGADGLFGGGDGDSLVGEAGNDSLDGGAGVDFAFVAGVTSLTANGSDWTLVSADGTDTLVNVEGVYDGPTRTLLVGSGGFATLQAAIDEAVDGDTILIAAGTYAGDATIDVDVTILGGNAGAPGSGPRGSESILAGGITIIASGVTFDGVQFSGEFSPAGAPWPVGVYVTGDNLTVVNSVFESSSATVAAAMLTGTVTGLEVADSMFHGYPIGAYVSGASSTGSLHDNLFQGDWSAGDPGNFFGMGNGVNSESSGVEIVGNQFDALYSGAVQVLAFGPAAIDVEDFVHGNSFTEGRAARPIQIYPNGDVISVVGSDESEAFNGDMVAAGRAFDFHGEGGHDRLYGGELGDTLAGGAGDDGLYGNGGNDSLDGGLGADALDGGAGTDTATFAGTLTAADFAYSGGSWQVGGDTLEGVEVVTDGSGNLFRLIGADGSDGHATIQAAVDAAASGDVLLVAPGTYDENVVIGTDGLTLLSVDGRATTIIAGVQAGGELGAIQLAPGADGITIGGVDAGFTIQGINGNGAIEKAAVYLQGPHDNIAIVGNEIVANGDLALLSEYGLAITGVVIDGNVISGVSFTGGYAGTGSQFDAGNNVPRPLVYLGDGPDRGLGNPSQNVVFTNNEVSGTAGGETGPGTGVFTGNQLVSIDAANSLVEGNLFSGNTEGSGFALRTRGAGTDVIDNELTGQSAGISVNHQGTPGTYAGNSLAGTGAIDVVAGFTPGDDTLLGNDGDDVLTGGLGDDSVDGGAGADTAVFAGARSDYTLGVVTDGDGRVTSFSSVSGGTDGTDALTSIEKLAFTSGPLVLDLADPVQLFSGGVLTGSFASIQAAIDAATGGETILVSAGTYDPFTVDVGVTIRGIGEVVIEGTFRDINSVPDGVSVGEWLQTATSYNGNGGVGATVASDGVALENLTFTGLYSGVSIGNSSDLTLVDVNVSDSVIGVVKAGNTVASDFTMTGGSLTDSYHGFVVESNGHQDAAFSDVLIEGVTFENLTEKGFYADNLSDAQLLDLVMTNVGQFGRGPAFGAAGKGEYGTGIDINVKYGSYENIEIGGFTFTDVGSSSEPDTVALDFGAAISIKARDDGPSYSGNPGSLTGVSIHDGTIDGTSTGIRIGEPGKGNAGPSGVTVSSVAISGAEVAAFDNASLATLTVTGTAGVDLYATGGTTVGPVVFDGGGASDTLTGGLAADSLSGGDGNDLLNGGDGNDTLTGGSGTDAFNGGSGFDTALIPDSLGFIDTVIGWISLSPDGNDVLNGVELAIEQSGQRTLLVGSTGFASIGEATASSLIQSGDSVLLASGSYSGLFTCETDGMTLLAQVAALDVTLESVGDFGITIQAGNFNDTITTAGGNDLIVGGGGADSMTGLGGDDTYYIDNVGDLANELAGGGTDTVFASVSYVLAAGSHAEVLALQDGAATTALNLTGSASDNTITGNAGANILLGSDGDDTLVGLAGNDILDGGTGADQLEGGIGDDRFYVDSASDVVVEANGEGTDLVITGVSYVLDEAAKVENLITRDSSATTAVDLTGNGLANTIIGNAGANVLSGGAGADFMQGHGGSDTYYVDNAGDRVVETAGGGTDTVYASVSYVLTAGSHAELLALQDAAATTALALTGSASANTIIGNAGANALLGSDGDDTLVGLAGNDILDGGTGADQLEGGAGNDRYYVDSVSDVVVEAGGEGTDLVITGVSYVLDEAAKVENLITRDSSATTAIGLTGNSLANTIIGNAGGNVLDGGGDADFLQGHGGNDTYYVDNVGDRVVESAAGGTDTVYASVSYGLAVGSHAEVLSLLDAGATTALSLSGSASANTITGNAGANVLLGGDGDDTIVGLAGNDILDGGTGTDQLEGGTGDDRYYVDSGSDMVVEASGEGTDLVISGVSFVLGDAVHAENLITSDAAATSAIDLAGNGLANTIIGNAGANALSGSGGNDFLQANGGNDDLFGGAGNDRLFGGAGADDFVFDTALNAGTNVDRVEDFVAAEDTIVLDRAVFDAIASSGALAAGAFHLGTAAGDADDRIVYDQATGRLFYDADGSGAGAQVLFATLTPGVALGAVDFLAI